LTRTPERPEPASRRRAGRIGRRVALGIYWLFMVYIAVVSFYSLVPQIFWPTTTETLEESARCDGELRVLVAQLREHAADVAADRVPNDGAHDDAADAASATNASTDFFRRWDDRYVALASRCEGDARYDRVGTLRHRIDTTTRRFAREDGRLFHEVERSLRTASPREGS
jgi:hypothetical protein